MFFHHCCPFAPPPPRAPPCGPERQRRSLLRSKGPGYEPGYSAPSYGAWPRRERRTYPPGKRCCIDLACSEPSLGARHNIYSDGPKIPWPPPPTICPTSLPLFCGASMHLPSPSPACTPRGTNPIFFNCPSRRAELCCRCYANHAHAGRCLCLFFHECKRLLLPFAIARN